MVRATLRAATQLSDATLRALTQLDATTLSELSVRAERLQLATKCAGSQVAGSVIKEAGSVSQQDKEALQLRVAQHKLQLLLSSTACRLGVLQADGGTEVTRWAR